MGSLESCCGGSNENEEEQNTMAKGGYKIADSDLEQQAKDFKLDRNKYYDGDEGKYRTENQKEIQNKRWEWYQGNTQLFSLILKNNGFDDEDIKLSLEHSKPLGMKQAFYDKFIELINTAVKKANIRLKEEYSEIGKIRIVLQGSYTVGYSSNPFKGDRFIPNYLFMPDKKSDYDFRCYAENLDGYIEKLRKDGIEIADRSEFDKDQSHLIRPKSVGTIFPEFITLMEEFEQLSKDSFNGKSVRLQISAVSKNIDFEPNPWDYEIEID